ncbi:Thioredoxin 1 [Hyella patelloides LEGE 07179]|uniref:Thioredoxin n=1 Tax=Hyella patelloides LEGE 07179 TaxID=945734 RepID=A0A563VUF2_9CYAN|nr:thioredoxin [Hyella patelloides]VEP15038.1 Thioredoxin 1 [Hyella patelloides LEGE 07179]
MSDNSTYINLNPDNFVDEVINSEIPVLVDFWAVWCGPCRVMNPTIENIAKKWQRKVKVAKADVDNNEANATKYDIRTIPTILIFQNGEIIERIPSLVSQTVLDEKLNNLTQDLSAA